MTYYACDIETTGLKFTEDRILTFGYWNPEESGSIEDLVDLKFWLKTHRDDCLIWQGGKFDQKFIYYHTGWWPRNDFDTLLAASLLPDKPDFLNLGVLVEHFLGLPSYKEKNFIKNLENEPIEKVRAYCLTDCERTYQICQVEVQQLQEFGNYDFFIKYLMPASDLLAKAEVGGITVDKDLLKSEWEARIKDIYDFDAHMREKYKDLITEYEDIKIDKHLIKFPKSKKSREDWRSHKKYRFNFTSPKQRQWLLKDKLLFPCEQITYPSGKKKVSITTRADIIEDYIGKHPIIEDLLTLSKLEKQEQRAHSLIEHTSKDGKIHSTFNMHNVRTGRLSSSSPNLQQIDRDED